MRNFVQRSTKTSSFLLHIWRHTYYLFLFYFHIVFHRYHAKDYKKNMSLEQQKKENKTKTSLIIISDETK